jgi:hypothetical protein
MSPNDKRVARLRIYLVEYSKKLSTLLDAVTALQTAGLLSFRPQGIQRAIGQIETVLADIDTGEVNGKKLARWFTRLDNGNFIERYTADRFVDRLDGPLMTTLGRAEKTWDSLHTTWSLAFTDEEFEGVSDEPSEGDSNDDD